MSQFVATQEMGNRPYVAIREHQGAEPGLLLHPDRTMTVHHFTSRMPAVTVALDDIPALASALAEHNLRAFADTHYAGDKAKAATARNPAKALASARQHAEKLSAVATAAWEAETWNVLRFQPNVTGPGNGWVAERRSRQDCLFAA